MKLYKTIRNLSQVFPKRKHVILTCNHVILDLFQDLISRAQIQHGVWKGAATFAVVILLLCNLSCTKFVTIDPPNSLITGSLVYQSDASATSALMGIYSKLSSNSIGYATGTQSISLLSGLMSDEFKNYSNVAEYPEYESNALKSANRYVLSTWSELYRNLQNINALIEGITQSTNISDLTKNQLLGEAKFLRAFNNFYLVNLFGEVPLVLSTNYLSNSVSSKSSVSEIYNQIKIDLAESKQLLSDNYLTPDNITQTQERVRPNKSAVIAMLARLYLYNKDWSNAETEATNIINNNAKYILEPNLAKVFLKNSTESIWQLMSVVPNYNTFDGLTFIINSQPSSVSLKDQFYSSFENNDKRKTSWTSSFTIGAATYNFPFKYKIKTNAIITEYLMVLRLSELYLIRAEARANQGKIPDAIADVDSIRNRAGLPLIGITNPNISKEGLLLVIENERRHELFTEWGHRWFDLKRTGRADAVLKAIKADWQLTDTILPIPQSEILKNTNLKPQNPGYN